MTTRTTTLTEHPLPADRSRALQIVAKSVYKELRQQGFVNEDVVTFASAMVGLISNDIRAAATEPEATGTVGTGGANS